METVSSIILKFVGTDIRFHPIYLMPFLVIGLALYLWRGRTQGKQQSFFGWLFPKEIYLHPSHIVDMKLFVVGRLLFLSKLLNTGFIQTSFVIVGMGFVAQLTGLEMSDQGVSVGRVLLATLIITITTDFCVYWVHRYHHETPIIWPFHAVHHSAEVMTPVTVYRKHPVYDIISNLTKAVLIGLVQGIILMLLMGKVETSVVMGINVFYFFFNFLGSNFRHSHIWLSYGRTLEHVFISPAQHQVHHSLDPKHHNKNYGEMLAIWDWMFGTLYVPQRIEELKFGISKSSSSNEAIAQPHGNLQDALLVPFRDSVKSIKRRHRKAKQKA